MGLINVNYNKFCLPAVENSDVIQKPEDKYDDIFWWYDIWHCLVNLYVYTEENCIPTRREPFALRKKVKLEEMCIAGILAKVGKPTDWVSQMVVSEKKSGDRIIKINCY